MSNPTSNFNWQMPTATDLVTDLPADFEVFGQAVDSSMADLLGGTTGQILAKNSNTNMDFVWITNDVGDITEVAAGTGISGGGTSGAVTITNSMATEITAKGDLIVGTGNATFDNLPAGTNGHVLTADSTVSPSGLKWSAPAAGGGMTLISTTTLSGASITLSSIASTYVNLQLVVRNFKPATDATGLYLRMNSDSNANRHAETISGDVFGGNPFNVNYINATNGQDNSSAEGLFVINIYDYANTATWKMIESSSMSNNSSTATNFNYRRSFGAYNQTSAISSIDLFPASGNFTSGTVLLYGVK
jgi:hypothetical protein